MIKASQLSVGLGRMMTASGSHGESRRSRVPPVRGIRESLGILYTLGAALIDNLAFRPSFADDETFEVAIERRFLLWYKCIRRTKPVTIDQVRTGDREYPTSTAHRGIPWISGSLLR